MNNRRNDSDWGSWVLIAILMASGLWFVGLPLLLAKLFAPDKTNQNRYTEAPPLYRSQYTGHSTSTSSYYNSQVRSNRPVSEDTGSGQQAQTAASSAASSAASQRARETIRNLSKSPKNSNKTAVILFVIGAVLLLIGLAMISSPLYWIAAGTFGADDIFGLLFSMGWLAGGASMIAGGIGMSRANKRYARYMAVIGTNPAIEISALAKKLGIKETVVRKDIRKMIEKGFFGNTAYVNEELGYLFTSIEADNELQKVKSAAMKKVQEAKEQQKQEEQAQTVSYYQSIIAQIRDVNDRIAHPVMTEKIYRLENITREIFRTVEEDPGKKNKIDRFLSYYLPTTLKLLESYAKLEKTGLEGDNIAQSMKSIESAMDSIVDGFEHQLDELYKTEVVDIETDIDVMTKMMNRDNGGKDDFHVEKYKTEPADSRTQFEKDFNVTRTADGTIQYGGTAAQTK